MNSPIVVDRPPLALALGLWTAAAVIFALSDLLRHLPPPAVPMLIFGTTIVAGRWAWRRGREVLLGLDLRWAIAVHVIRAPVGAWFLSLGAAGTLDPRFVEVAGYGDILAGVLALVAFVAVSLVGERRARPAIWLFNVVAALDILVVLLTAQRIILFDGGMHAMRGMLEPPGPLIPALLVPLVLLTHLLVFRRLRRSRGTEPRAREATPKSA